MKLFEDEPGDEGLAGGKRAAAMAALMMTTAMVVFDGSVINIALPQMGTSLQAVPAVAVWFANGYLLSVAMTLAVFASLARHVGFRPLFLSGLALFTSASLACSLAPNAPALIVARILQGLGGAAVVSIGPALLRSIFPSRLLGSVLGLNALLIAASMAIAPIVGGVLLDTLSWRWVFILNIVPGLGALVLAARFVHDLQPPLRGSFDVPGGVLSAVMVGALVMALDRAGSAGDDWYGLVAVVTGAAFLGRLHTASRPLLPLDMFGSLRFSMAALSSLAAFVGQGIAFVALPYLFQGVYGYSAFETALLFAPWSIGIVLVAPHAGRYSDRYSPVAISTLGLLVLTGALVSIAALPPSPSVWDLALRCFFCGAGFGCFQSPNNREMLSNVSRENSSYASGILAIMRTLGQCLGVAVVGVLMAHVGQGGASAILQQAVRWSLWIATGVTGMAIAFSLVRLRGASGRATLDQQPGG